MALLFAESPAESGVDHSCLDSAGDALLAGLVYPVVLDRFGSVACRDPDPDAGHGMAHSPGQPAGSAEGE